MLTFVKLGGSLITDKRVEQSFRRSVMDRLACEIADALVADASLKLVVGHGSGSFGHFAAARYKTAEGVRTPEEWRAFAEVATVAAELNYLVGDCLRKAGVPVWRIQPSASAISRDGELVDMELNSIRQALEHSLVPLVYGDVAIDQLRGGTIVSTERIFFYLAKHFPVQRVLLLGEVEGVLGKGGRLVSDITPANFSQIEGMLGGSAGIDVTGGMETKVRDMVNLVGTFGDMTIRIMTGQKQDLLRQTLLNEAQPGTLIRT